MIARDKCRFCMKGQKGQKSDWQQFERRSCQKYKYFLPLSGMPSGLPSSHRNRRGEALISLPCYKLNCEPFLFFSWFFLCPAAQHSGLAIRQPYIISQQIPVPLQLFSWEVSSCRYDPSFLSCCPFTCLNFSQAYLILGILDVLMDPSLRVFFLGLRQEGPPNNIVIALATQYI